MTFEDMGFDPRIVARLTDLGLTDPTPIQAKAIPLALEGRDVLGIAQTGTGKTAAFGLPIVAALYAERVKPQPKQARGLVLAPTRELAKQIMTTLTALKGENGGLRIDLVVGGKPIRNQINRLARGTDILVATPGRLIDLVDRNAIDLSGTGFLVLDEADQMLDIGFIHALRQIASLLSSERQTMMFSATMPKQMSELAREYLTNPERVEVSPPGRPAEKITQSVHFITKDYKQELLLELLSQHRDERAIIFARTKHGAERLMKHLDGQGYKADSIHGNKSQGQRDRALRAFKSGEAMVLVATDVAARGIDIPGVKFVYNYELPNVPENYIHRIGRTARAGAEGSAIAFCAPDEMGELVAIEKVLGTSIEVASGRAWEVKKGGGNSRRRGRPGSRPGGKPSGKPSSKFGGKPRSFEGKSEGAKEGGESRSNGKPKGKSFGKSFGKPGGKPNGKPGGKPSGKHSGKPGGKPANAGRGGRRPNKAAA